MSLGFESRTDMLSSDLAFGNESPAFVSASNRLAVTLRQPSMVQLGEFGQFAQISGGDSVSEALGHLISKRSMARDVVVGVFDGQPSAVLETFQISYLEAVFNFAAAMAIHGFGSEKIIARLLVNAAALTPSGVDLRASFGPGDPPFPVGLQPNLLLRRRLPGLAGCRLSGGQCTKSIKVDRGASRQRRRIFSHRGSVQERPPRDHCWRPRSVGPPV
jgi:hypothetical protein